MRAYFDRSNVIRASVQPGRVSPCPAVGEALRRAAPASPEQQYAADLAVIARCEEQIEQQAGCPDFFGCMGDLVRGRSA